MSPRGLALTLALTFCALSCKPGTRVANRLGQGLRLASMHRDAGPPARSMETAPDPRAPRMFRMDRAHTGRSGWHLPRHPHVVGRLPTQARISAQPVSVGDGGVAVGSHDGILYAATHAGAVRWRLNTGDRIYTTPAIADDGTLFVGTDADRFLAVSPRGTMRVALGTDDDADTSPVIAADNTVRFASGRTLYAVDPDLTVRWRLAVGGKIFSSPALSEGAVTYFGSQDDHVYAVSPVGAVLWRFAAADDVDATPMLDGEGNVYVGSDDGNVYAIRPDGAERWRHAMGGFVRAGAALGLDGSVIVGTYGPRARLVALDRESGRELWTYVIPGPPTREYGIASAPLVDADGRIAFGAPDDALHLVDHDGAHPSRVPLPADVDSAPVLVDDRLVAVGCDDGTLYLIGD